MSANGSPGNRTGKLGDALDVAVSTGAGTYVYHTDSANYFRCPAGNAISAAAWVFFDSLPSDFGYPIGRWGSGGDWTLVVASDGAAQFVVMRSPSTTTSAVTAAGEISAGAWYLVRGWFDPSTGANGTAYVQVNTGTIASAALAGGKESGSGVHVTLGDLGHSDIAFGNFDGAIDSASIWNRIPEAGDAAALYNGGAGLDYPFAAGQPTARRGVQVPHLAGRVRVTAGGGW